jgi:hypothetical protein
MNEAFAKHMGEEQAERKLSELRQEGWSCLRLVRSEVPVEFTSPLMDAMLAQSLPQAIRASEDMFATVNYNLNSRTCTIRIGLNHRCGSAVELFKRLLSVAKTQGLCVESSLDQNELPQELRTCVAELSKAKSGCFIATACYGSADAPEVLFLRAFRDQTMLHSVLGRRFVSFYYRHSRPWADVIACRPICRWFVRQFIVAPLVWVVKVFRTR